MKVHGIAEGSPTSAMIGVRAALGTDAAVTICEALQVYALHPECWSHPDQLDEIMPLLRGCSEAGVNCWFAEMDFTRNEFLRCLVRCFAKLAHPPYIRGRITYMNECVDAAEAKAEAAQLLS